MADQEITLHSGRRFQYPRVPRQGGGQNKRAGGPDGRIRGIRAEQ